MSQAVTFSPVVVQRFPEAINETIRTLIRDNGSRFGGIVFVKKDGTKRILTFQNAKDNSARIVGSELGAKQSATFAKNNPNMLRVWDHKKQAWRTVTLDRVISVRANGVTYKIRDPRTFGVA